jgi:hypothetical protein
VLTDDGVCEHQDLALVRGVGQRLGVSHHAFMRQTRKTALRNIGAPLTGGKDNLAVDVLVRTEGHACKTVTHTTSSVTTQRII